MRKTILTFYFCLTLLTLRAQHKYIPMPETNSEWTRIYEQTVYWNPPFGYYRNYYLQKISTDSIYVENNRTVISFKVNTIGYYGDGMSPTDTTIVNHAATYFNDSSLQHVRFTLPYYYFFNNVEPFGNDSIYLDFSKDSTNYQGSHIYGLGSNEGNFLPTNDSVYMLGKWRYISAQNTQISPLTTDPTTGEYDRPIVIEGIGANYGLFHGAYYDDLAYTIPKYADVKIGNECQVLYGQGYVYQYYGQFGNHCLTDSMLTSFVNSLILTPIQEKSSSNIQVFPNPSTNGLTINGENINSIEIYNSIGNKVLWQPVNNITSTNISLTQLTSGIYYVRIKLSSGELICKKVARL